MKLIVASLLCVLAYAATAYFRADHGITQRLVHVIEIRPNHPPKSYDLVEDQR